MEVEQVIDLADDADGIFNESQKDVNQEDLDIQEAIKLSLCDINFGEELEADVNLFKFIFFFNFYVYIY